MSDIKYPKITVRNFGRDGNSFALMAQVTQAMKQGGCTREQIDAFRVEARAGDYDALIQCCMRTVNCK